jgi:rifampicin phosphotransferase
MNYILMPHQSGDWANPVVGGKGSALARLIGAGVNVPSTFAITVAAYREFLNEPEVGEAVRESVSRLNDSADVSVVAETEKTLRRVLLSAPVSIQLEDEIREAYSQLGIAEGKVDPPVAVRSSATAEDLPHASFAGQYESFLGIRSASSVLEAVRKCWASLWSARAISYRQQQGIEHDKVLMAVLVQTMVNAEASGVLFTVNPVTSDTSQAVVNAVYGLGHTLASGEATPDQWTLRKQTGEILESRIADKTSMAVAENGALAVAEVAAEKRRKPAVSMQTLAELNKVGARLEQLFGCAQDVEWALEDKRLMILQSRAVTGIHEPVPSRRFAVAEGYWSRAGLSEWFQLPLSPLFSTLVLPQFGSAIDSCLKEQLGLRRPAPSWLVSNGYYYIRADVAFTPSLFLLPLRVLRQMFKVPDCWNEEVAPRHTQRINKLREFRPEEAPALRILQHFDEVCATTAQCFAWIVFSGSCAKLSELTFKKVHEFLVPASSGSYATLLAGFENKSVEADEALWKLCQIARSRPEVKQIILNAPPERVLELLSASESSRDWLARFHSWLETYGHRIFELDILYETMSDAPEIALQVVRNYVENPAQSPASRQQRKLEERRVAEAHFQQTVSRKFFIGAVAKKVLRLAQKYAALRESRPFYLHLGWPVMRRDVLELGRRFVRAGALNEPADVFFLTNDELRDWAAELDNARLLDQAVITRTRVEERRREWEIQKSLVPPEQINPTRLASFFSKRFLTAERQAPESADVLIGTAGSPGRALGNTCLVKSSDDFGKFKQGQILVAPYTTPVWTSLLSLAAGVVTETGGALSHAAIIAREYGIPAVVGVANAVARIPDGTNLEVDGSAGRVCLK